MISRLLLVGMVGVLGLSLPEGAEWGMGLTWARTSTTASAGRRNTVAFEPIAVVEEPINRLADELNCCDEDLDLASVPMETVAPRTRHEFAPVPSGDSVDLKLAAEFCRIEVEAEVRATIAPDSISRPVAIEANDAVDQIFAENQVWGDPMIVGMAPKNPPAPEPRPSFEPISVAETDTDLADAPTCGAEEFDMISTETEVPTLPRPSFEPIVVTADASNLADELNIASEGRSVEPDEDRGIGDAIRLTRNAALAWMSVLTKSMPTSAASR